MQRMNYSFILQGSKVEVSSDEDGYQNAWFSATVLHPPTPAKKSPSSKRISKATVRYDHILSDATAGEPLVEKLKVTLIRPLPPEDHPPAALEPYDVVDVFYDDAWWAGYVVGLQNEMYMVAFESPPDVLEVGRSELRPHWDWVDGSHWLRPTKEVKSASVFSPAVKIELDPTEDNPAVSWLPSVYLGEVDSGAFHMVKYQSSDDDNVNGFQKVQVDIGRIRPCPPTVADKDFDLLEKVDALLGSRWNVGVVTKFLGGKRYAVSFKHLKKEVEFDYSEIRPHMDWIDGKWVSKSKGLVFTSSLQEQFMHKCDKHSKPVDTSDHVEQKEPKFPGEERMNDTSSDEVVPTGNEKRTLSREEVEENGDQGTMPDAKREASSKSEFGSQLSESKFQNRQPLGTNTNAMPCSELEEVDEEISEFLNDDANAEINKEISEFLKDGAIEEAADERMFEPVVQECDPKASDEETSEPIMEDNAIRAGDTEFPEPNDDFEQPEISDTGVGLEDVMEADAESDDDGMACETNRVFEQLDMTTQNSPAQMEIDNETSKAVSGVEDCTTEKQETPVPACSKLTGNGASEAVDSMEDCSIEKVETRASTCSKLTDSQAQGSADGQLSAEQTISPKNANESVGLDLTCGTEVPFVHKQLRLWKFLESTDVFRKLPQSPHFRPLLKYVEKEREGLAIAHMVNYANLMVEISKLQPSDSTQHIDSLIKQLGGYAELGFDVEAVQGGMNEWRNTKAEIEKLKAERQGITCVIKEGVEEKERMDEEVEAINHRISELSGKRAALSQVRMEQRGKLAKSSLEAEAIRIDLESARERSRNLLAAIIPQ